MCPLGTFPGVMSGISQELGLCPPSRDRIMGSAGDYAASRSK